MKQVLVIASALLVSSMAFSQEQNPKDQPQVVCAEKAVQAAAMLFNFNTQQTPTDVKVSVTDIGQLEDGGYEVYDVVLVVGETSSSAYRVTTKIDGCKVISFEMPFAE